MKAKRVLIKFGGAAMKNAALADALFLTIRKLQDEGISVSFVHGGGPEIDTALRRLDIAPKKVDGLRVTDSETLEVVEMVLGAKVNKTLVSAARRAGLNAVGLSAIDGDIAKVVPKDPRLGFVGKIASVDPTLLEVMQTSGYFPIIASIAADAAGQHYNINGDELAAGLAAAQHADLFVLITDVPGVLERYPDMNSLIPHLTIDETKALLSSGKIASGMIPKIQACVDAIDGGCGKALICDSIDEELIDFLSGSGSICGTIFTAA